MLIRCIMGFRDLKTAGRPMRAVGEEWEVEPSRLSEINRAGYGTMAVEVPAGDAETAPAARKSAKVDAAPTADDLAAMTVRQLVELCIVEGVETHGRPKKAELLDALKAHYGLE